MDWLDLDSIKKLMHFSIGSTDNEVRFVEVKKKYEAGNESGWEKVSR
jgi:hypothetical protein